MAKEKKFTQKDAQKITSQLKKSVKVPKLEPKNVEEWLFNGNEDLTDMPLLFLRNKSNLLNAIQTIIPKFSNNPKMVSFMNLNFNDLYTNRTGEEILMFLKSYIQQNRILPTSLGGRNFFDPNYKIKSSRDRFFQYMEQTHGVLEGGDTGSIVAEYDMLMTNRFSDKKSVESLKIAIFGSVKESEEEKQSFNANIEEAINVVKQEKQKNDPRFIQKLDQEIIEKLKLTLIDIKSLENHNKILLVFIDENNKKKFFVDDFSYEFAVSNISSIVWNDYVTPFNKTYHNWVVCRDIREATRLRMAVNKSRDNFYRFLAWEN